MQNLVLLGFLGSFLAGIATGIGALPALLGFMGGRRFISSALGFSAGVMLAASFFSLIVPALDVGTVHEVVLGIFLGAIVIHLLDKHLPHEHFLKGREGSKLALRRIWLFALAITLHNMPEGLAVGVGFGSGDIARGIKLALAIGLQNMPEGLAVALPLVSLGYSRWRSIGYATLTGLVEPVMGLLGALAVSYMREILPVAMAFAAGAMIFVISDEIIPESHSGGRERAATFSLIAGFIVMMILDTQLG